VKENDDIMNLNLWIDKELFYDIEEINIPTEEKHFMVLAIVGLVMMVRSKEEQNIFITCETVLATMCNDDVELKPKTVKGFMNALNKLHELNFIVINKEVVKPHQMIKVDVSNILHKSDCSFFQISREEVQNAMRSTAPQHIITMFCNLSSRWNMLSYDLFEKEGWDKEKRYEHNTDLTLYKYLSCYPTLSELTATWCSRPNEKGEQGFNVISRNVKWDVGERTIRGYIEEMVDLGLICKITKNIDAKNHNYYCRPQHFKCVLEVLDILEEQQKFMNQK
jgi:hypothetical protein